VRAWVQQHLLPTGDVTVATLDGIVVGVVAVSRGDGYGWIDQMYVHPSLVGQGIGTRLLDHAMAVLPRPIRLYTFQPNLGARRFYERHGFQAVAFSDGRDNEEHCPDVLYELRAA
jgi:GNAT superfamily N-acetyltransferase